MKMMMMLRGGQSCQEILEVLQSYLDGEVDADRARDVAKHLGSCTACDRESQVYKSIKASLATRRRDVDPEILAALQQFGDELTAETDR